jgi:LPS sulfotransferase NodH
MSTVPEPRVSYLVCATPRSGSTLLCEALSGTGLAGRPAEYFEAMYDTGLPRRPTDMRARLDRWMCETEDPLLDGPVAPPSGVEVSDPHARSAAEPTIKIP